MTSNDQPDPQHTEGRLWSSAEIQRLFKFEERIKSRQTLLNAEDRGEIPRAERVKRGANMVRQWKTSDLPAIGARFGFLSRPATQAVVSFYMKKGGVGKTSVSFTLARSLALNGVKTLVVGLDQQRSITRKALRQPKAESLADLKAQKSLPGLYEFLYEGLTLADVTVDTDLPTLKVIPENARINDLERRLRDEIQREHVLATRLMPKVGEYDVVIFDNLPDWTLLAQNSVVPATVVVSPLATEEGCWDTLADNLDSLTTFQERLKLQWANFVMIPTMLDRSKLSAQIYGSYLNQYPDSLLPYPIRRAIKGQEALVMHETPFEYDPSSQLAADYYVMLTELWGRVVHSHKMAKAA